MRSTSDVGAYKRQNGWNMMLDKAEIPMLYYETVIAEMRVAEMLL